MFLKRIEIPHFRVLKDVELHFEPEFTPTVFPLGSLNGGGKSTLLQLIFTLLHCSFDNERHDYLSNLLGGMAKNNPGQVTIACFDLLHNDKEFSIEFVLHPDTFNNLSFNCFLDVEDIKEKISKAKSLQKVYASARAIQKKMNSVTRASPMMRRELDNIMENYIEYSKDWNFDEQYRSLRLSLRNANLNASKTFDLYDVGNYKEPIKHILSKATNLDDLDSMLSVASADMNKFKESLGADDLIYISHITDDKVLLCKTKANTELLEEISSKVYLATPSTQLLLFLSEDARSGLFSMDEYDFYSENVKIAKETLPGLFTYGFESTNVISSAFEMARDKDFKEALTSGDYGGNLKKLKEELRHFLYGKTITIAPDFSRVIFKPENSSEELYPEDLSHGELRKLSIYLWLNSRDIKDSLVLMDEIEIGMHPDWQYEIVNELQAWSSNNQFILATHSYELCHAVTPSHVKELEPGLMDTLKDRASVNDAPE